MRALLVSAVLLLGARAEAQRPPGLDVRVPERVDAVAGGNVALPIAIAVDRGLTVSKDAPVIVDLAPDSGVTIKKRRLGRSDAVDPDADAPRFSVAVRADAAGEHAVKIRLRLWLCGGKVCRPLDVRRQTTVAVAAAAAPPADAGVP
jgi:hypothetical protein